MTGCETCGAPITVVRGHRPRRYCSGRCKQAAFRARSSDRARAEAVNDHAARAVTVAQALTGQPWKEWALAEVLARVPAGSLRDLADVLHAGRQQSLQDAGPGTDGAPGSTTRPRRKRSTQQR